MAQTELNRRLTTTDASFLYLEKPTQPMHLGSCLVYDGLVTREEVIRALQDRMHLLPRYRQRAVFPPFAIAHPVWEDDPEFDVTNHVDEIELPAPADDQVLSEVGGQVFAQVLDRRRPLWKMVLLQGRPDGKTAMVMMVHHAMVDGVSGVDLMLVLHDLAPGAAPPAPPAVTWQPAAMPDPIALLQEAVRDRLVETARRWTDEAFRMMRPAEAQARAQQWSSAASRSMPSLLQAAPPTPFNAPLSSRRQFAWAEFSFAEIRAIRSTLGGTVNDVVLAVLSGGLGRYLREHGVPTEGVQLRAMCPVSMRRAEERGALGNLVSMMIAPLFVGIQDPLARLAVEREAMERLKREDQAGGLYAMSELANQIPPVWQAVAAQMTVPNTLLNTVSTNVPGPQIPLYLSGHPLESWYPLGPLATNIGLFNAILSYNKKLTFGATVDPNLVPDVWFFCECLRASFDELREAAERSATPVPATAAPLPEESAQGNGRAARRTTAAASRRRR